MTRNAVGTKRRIIVEKSKRRGDSRGFAFKVAVAMTLLIWTLGGLAILLAIYPW
jgi:hypothetical protein